MIDSNNQLDNRHPLIPAEEAAKHLGLGGNKQPGAAVRRLIRLRQLRGVRVAGKVMTSMRWIEEYVASLMDASRSVDANLTGN